MLDLQNLVTIVLAWIFKIEKMMPLYFLSEISKYWHTVFPHIVAAATILFWKFECGNYSREETIQRRKVIFDILTQLRNYINQHQLMFLLLKNIEISAKIVLFLKKNPSYFVVMCFKKIFFGFKLCNLLKEKNSRGRKSI